MKKLLALIASVFTLTAFAHNETVSFTHNGIETWGRVYYACSYVESQTKSHLEALGATNIDVDCRGGIEWDRMWPVSVTATFDAPALQGNEVAVVKTIKSRPGNESCSINVLIMKTILPKFGNVSVLEKRDRCSGPNTRWSYKLNVLE